MSASFSASEGPPPPPIGQQSPIYFPPPPEESPPSYYDATHSSSSPLLVGPPPNYGTYRDVDESSSTSSVIEETTRSLPEWVGQILVVLVFLTILYGFWRLVNDPDSFPS